MSTISPLNIVVLGGRGFLGSRVLNALERAGLRVQAASRRGPLRVDSACPETFSGLSEAGLIVDLSDTVTSPPDALIEWCIAAGKVVLEATSDSRCIDRLLNRSFKGPGRLILGGGIFTGLSNLLARDVAGRVESVERVVLGISSNPFSAAGGGTIALMVDALDAPVVRYAAGEPVVTKILGPGPPLDFSGTRRPTLRMALPEVAMLHRSAGAPNVDAYFAPRPALLVPAFLAIPAWLARRGWFKAFMRGYFTVLRKWLFRSTPSEVELMAEAVSGKTKVSRSLIAVDGMLAAGYAIAAMVEAVAQAKQSATGTTLIDDETRLEAIVDRINQLAETRLITLSAPAQS